MLSFANSLAGMRALRFLDVQRNRLTDRSKKPIIAALKDNMELERLDLDGTWDRKKSFYLSLNRGGRRLLQTSNTAPLGLWPLVLERANSLQFGRNQPHANLDVLYCLLLQGPAALLRPTRKRKTEKEEESQDELEKQQEEIDEKFQDIKEKMDEMEENLQAPSASEACRSSSGRSRSSGASLTADLSTAPLGAL